MLSGKRPTRSPSSRARVGRESSPFTNACPTSVTAMPREARASAMVAPSGSVSVMTESLL